MKRIALVTGASSGMGKEVAIQIATDTKHFCIDEIWLVARRRDRLEELSSEIERRRLEDGKGCKSVIMVLDASGKSGADAINKCLEMASHKMTAANGEGTNGEGGNAEGGIEIAVLVNNAGWGTYGPFAESDVTKEMDMVELNCTALTGITGYALPYMARGGIIINTSSLAAFMPLGNFAVYAATKAYVLSFTVALAAEVKDRGIKVCALCPGSVSTEFALVASGGARRYVAHGVSALQVVHQCLKDARRGKAISMPRLRWRAMAFASRLVGRMFCARITNKFCPRPHKKD